MIEKFKNKKLGIWGFGVVGKSALQYFQKLTKHIQILDTQKSSDCILQTPQSTEEFLHYNDYILTSPGIKLHDYEQYKHKFITEVDIFQEQYHDTIIAITGTLGKTTITTLLSKLIPHAIAGGNIGHAMLNVLHQSPPVVILELSSFQLHYAQQFAPDIAILTNFYPNHLDHHKTEQEYWQAKCNIFAHQTENQIALLPCQLLQRILVTHTVVSKIYLFCSDITCTSQHHQEYPTFTIRNNNIINTQNNSTILNNISQLPAITYLENWLIISVILHLQNINLQTILHLPARPEEHRLEYVTTIGITKFYNDSKSTVWQASKQAIETFKEESCILFLGGLSKGTDRSPLIEYLASKNIVIIAFGHEAATIQTLCNRYNITCSSHSTLEDAWNHCLNIHHNIHNVILSPGGSSFDLFTNYIERGTIFKKLIKKHTL